MTQEIELVVDAQAEGGESPSWDKEKHVLYWVDIDAFDYNLDTGDMSNRRKVISIRDGYPDGMTTEFQIGFNT